MITMDVELTKEILNKGKRFDKRDFLSYRNIEIKTNVIEKAAGSAEVHIGNTKVLAGIKIEIGEPFEDTPDKGAIMVNTEFIPFANEEFEAGPPSIESIEVARVADRVIRESKCIDLENLVVEKGKKVWVVFIDIDILDQDGNLHDAVELAAISALLTSKLPVMEEDENGELKPNYEKFGEPLKIRNKPVSVTIGKINNKLIIDPSIIEENALDARLTVGLFKEDDKYKFCALQKGGQNGLTREELDKCFDLATEKYDELVKKLPQ